VSPAARRPTVVVGQTARKEGLAIELETEPFIVRPLDDDEIERVAAVLGLARLYQGDGFYLVAWEHDEPLGHAHLALTDPPELQDVSVRPEQRRRGVASAITASAEREARERGFNRLRLHVSAGNEGAQALYRRSGYVDAGVPPRRVKGTVLIRTGPLEVDDTILTWEKQLDKGP
jgi:GNAT superfamily N-acetyltransferase